MSTIIENKEYLENSSRYPKLTSVVVPLPDNYKQTSEEYNKIIEYLGQLYERSENAVYNVDTVLDPTSQNPISNEAAAEALDGQREELKKVKVSFFRAIKTSGMVKTSSSTATSTPDEVYFFSNNNEFGYVQGVVTPLSQYYNNWVNRDEYSDGETPYEEKLYFCIEEWKLYVWENDGLVPIGGDSNIEVDAEGEGDLDISDMNGNVLGRFENGHFRTKNFYSGDACTEIVIDKEAESDLDITDESGNVLGRFEKGHFRTKNFNSANYYTKAEIDALINQLLSQINS